MPAGELIAEGLGAVLRVAGRLVFEAVVELLIMGTGRVLIRVVRPGSEPGDMACGIIGILFWAAICAGLYALHRATAS